MTETTMDRSYYPPLSKDIAAWRREYTPGPLTEEEFHQFFEDGFRDETSFIGKRTITNGY